MLVDGKAIPETELRVVLEQRVRPGWPATVAVAGPLQQQKRAVDCGHWPLYRYRPAGGDARPPEFLLDSVAPRIPIETYASNELRYQSLSLSNPDDAARLLEAAQQDAAERWQTYRDIARNVSHR